VQSRKQNVAPVIGLSFAALSTAHAQQSPQASGHRDDRGHGAALQREVALTPGGITLIDAEDLSERNVATLADLLHYVPGVWSASNNGSDSMFFSSRGSNLDATDYDMNGIKLLQDGLPVTTADGNNHNRVLDPLAARYATVARGANALKYGASTLGGTVDFVSPTARNSPAKEVFVNAGSHGQLLARGTAGEVFSERFDGGQANEAALTGDFQLNVETLRLASKTVLQLGGGGRLDFGLSLEKQSLFHPIVDVRIDFDGPGRRSRRKCSACLWIRITVSSACCATTSASRHMICRSA
jgi:iron complex outermembrane receptor protein